MTTRTLRTGGLAALVGLSALGSAHAQNSVGSGISGTPGGQGAVGTATAPSLRGTDLDNPRETTGSTGKRARPAAPDDNLIPGENDRAAKGTVAPRRDQMMARNAGAYEEQAIIGHAVTMAIEAAGLKACAVQAGAQEIEQAEADNDRPGGARMDPAEQLMLHARKGFQGSQALLGSAGGDVIGQDRLRPATDRNPGDRRIFEAAGGYISTLATLSGMNYGRPVVNPAVVDASRDPKPMTAEEKASVALINHSVKQVIEGSHILRASAHMQAGSSLGAEALVRHAREMRTNGSETLLRIIGNNPQQAAAEGASVLMLAQRGRELVEAMTAAEAPAAEMTREPGAQPGRNAEATAPREADQDIPAKDASPLPDVDGDQPATKPQPRDSKETAPESGEPKEGSILNGTAPSSKEKAPR